MRGVSAACIAVLTNFVAHDATEHMLYDTVLARYGEIDESDDQSIARFEIALTELSRFAPTI